MKQRTKKTIILLIFNCVVLSMNAETIVTVNNLKYSLSGLYASVCGLAAPISDITIPAEIEYMGQKYIVNAVSSNAFAYYDSYDNPFIHDYPQPMINGYKPDENHTINTVVLPNSIQTIGTYAFSNNNISSVCLGNGLKSIGILSFAFSNISEVRFPEGLEKIGAFAFYNSKISRVIIPKTFLKFESEIISNHYGSNYLYAGTFDYCNFFREIIYLCSTPPDNWVATSLTYVPNSILYNSPNNSINNASIIEMINFRESSFTYTGQEPITTWTNNMQDYSVSLSMSSLNQDVGTYNEIIPVTFSNESESFTANVSYSYEIQPVTVTATVTNKSKKYGEVNPSFEANYSGFIDGEDETVITNNGTFHTTATTSSCVGEYPITLSGVEAKNYVFDYIPGTLAITKAPLLVKPKDKTMNYGSNVPTLDFEYEGLKNDEQSPSWVTMPTLSTTASSTSDVGEYLISISDGEATNYELTTNSGTLTILKKNLTVQPNNANRTYGDQNPTITLKYTGLVNNETEPEWEVAPTIHTEASNGSDVGDYDIFVNDGVAKNYEIESVKGILTINKASLTATPQNASREYGDDNPVFELSYNGLKNNELAPEWITAPIIGTNATKTSSVGTYSIELTCGEAKNYAITGSTGNLTIEKAPLVISVLDCSKKQGAELPNFTINYNGFKNNETSAVLSSQPIVTCMASKTSAPGTYEISISNAEATNYDITYQSGILTVLQNDNMFMEDNIIYEIRTGNSVAVMGDETASGNYKIPSTVKHEGNVYKVTSITEKAFFNCSSITSVEIPKNVTVIGNGAFMGCTNLSIVSTNSSTPAEIESTTFPSSYITLYVPKGSKSAYMSAENWGAFSNIVEKVAQDLLYVEDVKAYKNDDRTILPIMLSNLHDIAGLQFDLILPNNISIEYNAGNYVADVTRRTEGFDITASNPSSGVFRFVVKSDIGTVIPDNSGAVLNISLKLPDDIAEGNYEIKIENVTLTAKANENLYSIESVDGISIMSVSTFILGDVNDDNAIDVTDVVYIISYILKQNPSSFIVKAADLNNDGEVNVTDVVSVISRILSANTPNNSRTRSDIEESGLRIINEGNGVISLKLENAQKYVAAQFMIKLSRGQVINDIILNPSLCNHSLAVSNMEHGIYNILLYSLCNETYPTTEGELFKLYVGGKEGNVSVENIMMVTPQFEQKRFSSLYFDITDVQNKEFEIYSIDGKQVGKQAKNINGLSRGVYVINGKKTIIK